MAGRTSAAEPRRTLYGRTDDLRAIRACLADGVRLLTLRGAPGVGKTTIARHLVEVLAAEGARETHFISLAEAVDRSSALATIARSLGFPHRTTNQAVVIDRIARQLESRPALMVLDGVERVAADLRPLLDDLMYEVSEVVVVVTSRRAIGSPFEHVVSLSPLAIEAACEMLFDRVHQIAPKRTFDRATVSKLAQRSAGVPLALEIIAGWIASLGAKEALNSLSAGELPLEALDETLNASWALLGPEERRSFAAFSVFRNVFDLGAAQAVAGTKSAASHLAVLVSASLLEVMETEEGARYSMLDGVRAYAKKRAEEEYGAAISIRRLSEHLARSERPRADLHSSWKRLAEERDDLIAAWQFAIESDAALALRLAVVIEPIGAAQGPAEFHRAMLLRTISLSEERRLPGAAREHAAATIDLLYSVGRLDAQRGRYTDSLAPLERGVALAEAAGDSVRAAWLLAHLARSRHSIGRVEGAHEAAARARQLANSKIDQRLHSTIAQTDGFLFFAEGAFEQASSAYRRAAAAARAASAVRLLGQSLLGSARVELERGDATAAADFLVEARGCFEQVSDGLHLGRVAACEGRAALLRGEVALAEDCLMRALDEASLQEDVPGELEAHFSLALLARAKRDPRGEERRLDDFDVVLRRTDDTLWQEKRSRHTARLNESAPVILALDREGKSFELFSHSVDFARRGPLRRILIALAERRHAAVPAALTVDEIRAVGWPDEKMSHASGAARVYMAIKRLRSLGLDPILRTTESGYTLDSSVVVVWR